MRRDPLPLSTPLVAIVGRPNVGKSTLFNRLCGGHDAIVEDQPGVTRDRRYGASDFDGVDFRVVDTGGLDYQAASASTLARDVLRQAMRAVEEAAVILFVVDGRDGLMPQDREVAERLRKIGKPVLYVANKIDGPRQEPAAAELYELGIDPVFAISAAHGRGMADLLDAVVAAVRGEAPDAGDAEAEEGQNDGTPDSDDKEEKDDTGPRVIRIALVGRPNAGKSSLINRLVGEERMIVDSVPGTTRDPVDTLIEHRGQQYLLIDTAGIRRRAKVHEPMEKIAVAMAEKAVNRADVAILVIDAAEGIGEQDARIAGLVQESGRALIIAFNKRDLIDADVERKLREDKERQLQFVPWALLTTCSAQTGRGVAKLLEDAQRCYASYNRRVSTGELNRFFDGIVERHPPPLFHGHPIRLYYITQAQVRPPSFMISVNYPQGMHFSYERYLQNQIRETFAFVGTPIRIMAREHKKRIGPKRRPET